MTKLFVGLILHINHSFAFSFLSVVRDVLCSKFGAFGDLKCLFERNSAVMVLLNMTAAGLSKYD